jgi:hypothetical protein
LLLADDGLWQQTYDRYDEVMNHAIIVQSIDLTESRSLFLSSEDEYSVSWSGLFCFAQSYISDYIGLHVTVSSSDDIVMIQSSQFAGPVRFNFNSDFLENSTLLLLSGHAGLSSKRICGTLNVLYNHSHGSSRCRVLVGDAQSQYGTTAYYPNEVHIKGSPFAYKIAPGNSLRFCSAEFHVSEA